MPGGATSGSRLNARRWDRKLHGTSWRHQGYFNRRVSESPTISSCRACSMRQYSSGHGATAGRSPLGRRWRGGCPCPPPGIEGIKRISGAATALLGHSLVLLFRDSLQEGQGRRWASLNAASILSAMRSAGSPLVFLTVSEFPPCCGRLRS
jgi:hypothetical protein